MASNLSPLCNFRLVYKCPPKKQVAGTKDSQTVKNVCPVGLFPYISFKLCGTRITLYFTITTYLQTMSKDYPADRRTLFFGFPDIWVTLFCCFCWVIYAEINEKQNSRHWPPGTGPQWVISECVLSKAQTNELDWMKAFIKSTLNTVSSVSACRSHSAWLAP